MMKRTCFLLAFVFVAGIAMSGCRFAAQGIETATCANCAGNDRCGAQGKWNAMWRQQARNFRKNERCVDNLFFNYDVNDPYRGDCLVGY